MENEQEITTAHEEQFCSILDEMAEGFTAAREVITRMLENVENSKTKDGISLLSIKYHVMLSYLQTLVLLETRRFWGHSLQKRTPSILPFSDPEHEQRGHEAGDLVDSLVEKRAIMDKAKTLEGRLKYQIDKLVKMAKEQPKTVDAVLDDPLAFRPNPENLVADNEQASEQDEDEETFGTYRPPRLAPVPYTEATRRDKVRKGPTPAALEALHDLDSSAPYTEKTTGLGVSTSMSSARSRELQRMTEFEEENMTRLVMNKKAARRRKQDEASIALGGSGFGRTRGGGMQDEFGDILRNIDRPRKSGDADAYEDLRRRGKRKSMLERARERRPSVSADAEGPARKRGKFEASLRRARRKMNVKTHES